LEKKRILVIDDDEVVRDNLKAILELEGYNVDTAETGKDAILRTNKSFYNLALIYIHLPGMQGTELLPAMKETTPKMIKIVITGYASPENEEEAFKKGADHYIAKPVRIDDLLKTIKEHLKKQEEKGKPKIPARHERKKQSSN
jgi:two-component system response regulator HydG